MQVVVTFRHMEATDALRRYAEGRVQRIRKFLRRPIEAHVVLSVVKRRHVADVTVVADHATLHAAEQTDDLYSAVDLAMGKIERQIKKLVTKRQGRKHAASAGESASAAEESADAGKGRRRRVRRERVVVEAMSVGEAIERLADDDRGFVVFQNLPGGAMSIVYERKDGSYAVVEPEVP